MTNYTTGNSVSRALRKKRTLISIVLFTLIIGFVLSESTGKAITLQVDGQIQQFTTNAHTVQEALDEIGVEVSAYDDVQPPLDTTLTAKMIIDVEKAKKIEISVNEEKRNVWTTENVVKNILAEANIDVAEDDKLSHSLHQQVGEDGKIDVEQAFEITIVDGRKVRQVAATSTTIANVLQEQGIQLGELDRIDYSLDEYVTPGQTIEIVRVKKVTDVMEDKVAFEIEMKNDDTLLKGRKKVLQRGKRGTLSRTYEVVLENGKEVSRTLAEEKVVSKPVNQIVAVGTKTAVSTTKSTVSKTAPITSVLHNNQVAKEPSAGRELTMTATAYTATCKGCIGITKTGINLLKNPHLKVIAVDPKVIPLGSDVWVEGYGYAVAGDTGGAIKGNIIDLFMPNVDDAYDWGRRTVRVKVLN
ncbi:G5 and 3D domain-containing protein [Caryophanon latum]|uniref:G5 domain-containing protein n=1 Tax=Caryophanon latum TaxID=33977 RepID=A0A1C0YYH7_9BACL|nr:G5 and 3D domain-containing protein [Caryophanon latum]OCS92207.1 hypothetical protein A6K76_07445 [Caryophanon latum]